MQNENAPKITARRTIFESKKFRVVEKDIEFASGDQETWEVVEQKGNGGARILALTDRRELIFVREYRGAAEKYVLRIPTGVIEEGEDPKEAARRELKEETGFAANNLEFLGKIESTSGYYSSMPLWLFYAGSVEETGNTARELGEQAMEVVYIPLEKALQMAELAEFEDIQTVYALLLLKKFLRKDK